MTDPLPTRLQASLGGAYTLGRELGGGGMSRVFVARDEALGRDVVVKVLAPELAAGLSAERFAREIRLAAALQEPHIVPVHAAGTTADGLPYYTMPFVRGESLRARLAQGPVPSGEAVSILRDVARALAYAHRQGIVHRDIKPENVLLHEGTAVVTDFGIAKAVRAARTAAPDGPAGATLTSVGTSLGTPAYMAPEQAVGDEVDARADLYAWGVVAYELLAGRHPFAPRRTAHELVAAHLAEVPAPLAAAVPALPPPLAAIVTRCLEKRPEARPSDAAALLVALDAAPTPAGGPSLAGDAAAARSGQRRRAAFAGVTVAILALGAAAAWRVHAADGGADAVPLVAVLPFETASGGGVVADTAFGDGLGDAITGKLARLAGLRVIDRASVRTVERAAARPVEAGRTLGADYVLRATLRWARGGDGRPVVQVSPVLVRVADGGVRWAGEPTVVAPADPFAAQGQLAADVARALEVALAPAERARLAETAAPDTAAFAAVERGVRLLLGYDRGGASSRDAYVRALGEFELAYRRDPENAEAWGRASTVLQRMAQWDDDQRLIDSAAVLARRAVALDPGNYEAVNTLSVYERSHDRGAAARAIVEDAVRAYPSSPDLRGLRATAAQQEGDTAAAWPAALEALRLAPRSYRVLLYMFRVALSLRRYDDAAELLARLRAVEPGSLAAEGSAAQLAAARGDRAAVARAVQGVRTAGARVSPGQTWMLRAADGALGDELLAGTPATFAARTALDSVQVYLQQALLLLARGDPARARAIAERGLALRPRVPAGYQPLVALLAAVRGDGTTARAALAASGARYEAVIKASPAGIENVGMICVRAHVEGLLGDVAAMLPPLRQCLTMPNGEPLAALAMEPAFARHRDDARVRALAAELAAAEARRRSGPVQSAR